MKNFLLALCFLPLCSCASIVSNKNSPITVDSSPSGAKVEITDSSGHSRFVGETPATTTLPNGDGYFTKARYTVKVSKDGYEPAVTNLVADMNGWYWGNFLVGGLIGFLIVDPITGAMFEFEDPQVHTNLAVTQEPRTALMSIPPGMPSKEANGDDTIVESVESKIDLLKKLRDEGILTEKEYQQKKKEIVERSLN